MRLPGDARVSRWSALSPTRCLKALLLAVGSELARAVCQSASKLADLRNSEFLGVPLKRLGDKPLHLLSIWILAVATSVSKWRRGIPLAHARGYGRIGGLTAVLCLVAGCKSPLAREPLNLDTAKAAVVQYYESGNYERAMAAVAAKARDWIEQYAAHRRPDERLAVVFDIDDTLLSNYPHIHSIGFGYIPSDWEAWIARGEAPAIKPMRELFLAARHLGCDVFLITDREEPSERAATEANLRREGLGDYTRLIMQPAGGPKPSVSDRKTAARRALYREGYTIIANLGDQESDLRGGYEERSFKLPDPLYLME